MKFLAEKNNNDNDFVYGILKKILIKMEYLK